MIRWLALMILLALPAHGEEVLADLSQNRVSITANFDGSEILIFGAVKRETPIPRDGGQLEVLITVAGPSVPVTVRRKAKWNGLIWINTEAVEVDSAPSFYKVATSGPFNEVLKDTEDLRHKVSIERAIRSVGAPMTVADAASFTDALIRIRKHENLYQEQPNAVIVNEQTLFRTSVALPSNLTEGNYTARIFLTRDGRVVDVHETVIYVQKVGLERFLYNLAHERPLVYGILSLVIAISAGWTASAVFRYLRS
ncbi:MAG: TIGR02186 family protein [Rhodobacter sp.]|nr:TIGR02186 family protein [Rhodobacter sp.]